MDGPWGHLALLFAAILIVWIYHGIDQNSALEHPLSLQFLLPLLSSGIAFAFSFSIKRVVGSPGRFDDDGHARRLEESKVTSRSKRPPKGSSLLLSFLIACRLFMLSWLQPRFQCTYAGVEALLPALLAAYEGYWYLWGGETDSTAGKEDEEDDHDDMALDTFEFLARWFISSPLPNLLGAFILRWGYLAATASPATLTLVCPASEWRSVVLFGQLSCLILDAVILTLAWRIMQWARSTADRAQSLGMILLSSAATSGLMLMLKDMTSSKVAVAAAGSVDTKDMLLASDQSAKLVFITATLFATQVQPLSVASIVIFLCGVYSAGRKLALIGTYEQVSKVQIIYSTSALSLGFIILAYRTGIRHVGLPRGLISFILATWVLFALIRCALVNTAGGHTIDKIIYSTRTEVSRWLVQDAKVSESLSVAVNEYQDRHNGRKPPPNFDMWYEYATARNSPIIDHFKQIDEDLQAFWKMSPEQIRKAISKLTASEGISIVSIKDGSISSPEPADDPVIGELVQMIQPFAQYLPDMDLAVNLLDRPRVLPPWLHLTVGYQDTLLEEKAMWAWEHHHQLGQACPPDSASRPGFHSPAAEFCGSCARRHSIEQYPTTSGISRDLCHQPDMFNLHGFYINHHPVQPFNDLIPVFSRTKTNQYKDILIPLSRGNSDYDTAPDDKSFAEKQNQLFWRGAVAASSPLPPGLLRGGHQERLSHILNNVSASDQVTVLLQGGDREPDKFRYEAVSSRDINHVLQFDAGLSDYSACTDPSCELFKKEFGIMASDEDNASKFGSRHVMVMDGDFRPPQDLLSVLRSNSVPFVASIFKEWYTERLFPWLHYVPIDLRFHGLHSTLVYFMGLEGDDDNNDSQGRRPVINGRERSMAAQVEDAQWIAQEGKQWAARALRREDASVYLFRLLLEWGRVISEDRESPGFEMGGGSGSVGRRGWSQWVGGLVW
ncbi:unnamed protein product [Discula destructiva]